MGKVSVTGRPVTFVNSFVGGSKLALLAASVSILALSAAGGCTFYMVLHSGQTSEEKR